MARSEDEISAIERIFSSTHDPLVSKISALLQKRLNVILYGPPGTGKTRVAFAIQNEWRRVNGPDSVLAVTFHPSYTYEDFVRGYKPSMTKAGAPTFSLQDGVLLEAASRATAGPVLLSIDEINRGDVARIFGELITYIEYDKRDTPFQVASPRPGEVALTIPKGLHFLATMNSADKSVSLLDVALRRRFALVEMAPDPGVLETNPLWEHDVAGVNLAGLLSLLNRRLLAAGVEPDRLLGQALLAVPATTSDATEDLRERFEYDIYPLITEYFFLDRAPLVAVLGGLVDETGRFRRELTGAAFEAALQDLVRVDQGSRETQNPLSAPPETD